MLWCTNGELKAACFSSVCEFSARQERKTRTCMSLWVVLNVGVLPIKPLKNNNSSLYNIRCVLECDGASGVEQ